MRALKLGSGHLTRKKDLVLQNLPACIVTVKADVSHPIALDGDWKSLCIETKDQLTKPETLDWGTDSKVIVTLPEHLHEFDEGDYFSFIKYLRLKNRDFGTTIVLNLLMQDTRHRAAEPLFAVAHHVIIHNSRKTVMIKNATRRCNSNIKLS